MEKNATQALKVYYEDIVPERSTVWFHPVTPLVCTVTERNQVKITNYESGKCLAFFDIFSGPQALADPRCARPFNCIDAIFVDKYSLIWNAGSSDVASGLALKFKTHSDIQTLILVDRCSLVRWDYCTEKWALTDILFDGRIGATKAVLYDENVLVLGFEDGTLKLFNYMAGSWVAVLKDSHKSAISQLLVFARDLTSKPLVVTAESAGAVFCWNMESQAVAFKFSEMAKGKSVRLS
jgi:WD40 repeat protein